MLPFVNAAKISGKGLFILVKTSNPTSGDIQNLLVDGRPLYERLSAKGITWGRSESTRGMVLHLIRDEPLTYRRGERSEYSDLGFILLGLTVERASGRPLDEYFYESVARPLRAQPLCFTPTAMHSQSAQPEVDVSNIAPTEWDEWRRQLLKGQVHDENAAAMGGVDVLVTTTSYRTLSP